MMDEMGPDLKCSRN